MNDQQLPRHLARSTEWYTPARYITAARRVMGAIELDPASCELANQVVRAERYYDQAHNGLQQPWQTRSLWLNPPYCKSGGVSNQEVWTCKLIAEYEAGHVEQAILLVNAATETRWFHRLYQYPVCFTNHRIHFYSDQSHRDWPTVGQAFVYFGLAIEQFTLVFSQFGTIVRRVGQRSPLPLWEELPYETTS
jgi:ParB family chromosome partitioning protein